MADELIDLVKRHLGGDAPAVLGALFGESPERIRTALAGAVPAVLAVLTEKAESDPEAGGALAAMVAQGGTSSAGSMMAALGRDHQAIAEQGGGMLRELLGEEATRVLAGAAGRYGGIGRGSARSLTGVVAAVVAGALADTLRSQAGSDPAGLLARQKEAIAAALPPEMAEALARTGLGGEVARTHAAPDIEGEDSSAVAGRPAPEPARPIAMPGEPGRDAASGPAALPTAGREAPAAAPRSGGRWIWLLVLLILLVAALGYFGALDGWLPGGEPEIPQADQ